MPKTNRVRRLLTLRVLARNNAYGPVAQGIEQQPSKLKVAGSNPAGVASKINSLVAMSVGQSSQKNMIGKHTESERKFHHDLKGESR
jgi:hypothetical protein